LLGKCGIDASHHVSRQLNGRIISGAELILTMELSQRSWVSGEVPGVMRRTFTLLEFARLAVAMRGSHPESLEDMVQRAAANRAVYPVAPDGSDEIADPNGRTIEVYRTVFTQIQNAIQGIAQELLRYPQLRSLVKTEPFAGFAP
jgi:protein-tyrosine phosphatase